MSYSVLVPGFVTASAGLAHFAERILFTAPIFSSAKIVLERNVLCLHVSRLCGRRTGHVFYLSVTFPASTLAVGCFLKLILKLDRYVFNSCPCRAKPCFDMPIFWAPLKISANAWENSSWASSTNPVEIVSRGSIRSLPSYLWISSL